MEQQIRASLLTHGLPEPELFKQLNGFSHMIEVLRWACSGVQTCNKELVDDFNHRSKDLTGRKLRHLVNMLIKERTLWYNRLRQPAPYSRSLSKQEARVNKLLGPYTHSRSVSKTYLFIIPDTTRMLPHRILSQYNDKVCTPDKKITRWAGPRVGTTRTNRQQGRN